MPENEPENPDKDLPEAENAPVLHDAPLPKGVSREMLLGIGVGVLFAGASLAAPLAVDVPKAMQHVLLATGVAIILTAFGGQATVAVKSAIFAGVTATMLAILWFLGQSDGGLRMARGQITDFDWRQYEAKLKFSDYSESFFDAVSRQFRFVAFDDNMTTAEAVLIFTPRADGPELPQIKLPVSCFSAFLGRGAVGIDWAYDSERHVIVDKRRSGLVIGSALRAPEPDPCQAGLASATGPVAQVFLTANKATKGKAEPLDPALRDKALADLVSDEPEIRRIARDVLASGAPADVPFYLARLGDGAQYRTKLGVAIAMTEMLRLDKSLAGELDKAISPDNMVQFARLIGDGERTLRITATEFLYDLGSAEGTRASIRLAAQSTDNDAIFDWLFAGQGGWLKMTREEKSALAGELAFIRAQSSGKPKITGLLAGYR